MFVRCGRAPPQESLSHPCPPLSCAGWPVSQPAGPVWTPVTQQWTEAAARSPQAHAGSPRTVHLAVQRRESVSHLDQKMTQGSHIQWAIDLIVETGQTLILLGSVCCDMQVRD